jgi:hypothetical protein
MAWSSIGGMLGRSKGPLVTMTSCREESTVTLTVGDGSVREPTTKPSDAAASRLHTMTMLPFGLFTPLRELPLPRKLPNAHHQSKRLAR